jgi:hypothetical protein
MLFALLGSGENEEEAGTRKKGTVSKREFRKERRKGVTAEERGGRRVRKD